MTPGMGGFWRRVIRAEDWGYMAKTDVFPKMEELLRWHELHWGRSWRKEKRNINVWFLSLITGDDSQNQQRVQQFRSKRNRSKIKSLQGLFIRDWDSFQLAYLSSAAITKYHRLGGLNKIFTSHSSGSWEVQDQSASQFGSWWEPASCLAEGRLLTVSSSFRVRSEGCSLFFFL